MSKESIEWLNTMTLQGFTEKRGNAWHYLKSAQGVESNSYPLAIPVEDVRRRLFSWKPISTPVTATVPESTVMDENGVTTTPGFTIVDTDRQAIVKPEWNGQPASILGVFKSGYQIHDYGQWLVNYVDTLLDGGISIGSAGLLKGGAVAWVSMELEDTYTHKSGVAFRPRLTATTSLDGSLATTYLRGHTITVCDNTLSAALREHGALKIKIKHSARSAGKVTAMRDALELLSVSAEDFSSDLDALTSEVVSDDTWADFLKAYAPIPEEEGRSQTMAQNKVGALQNLWSNDLRVAPWKGSAWGVVQAVSTYTQHEQIIRGAMSRPERNQMQYLTGAVDAIDASTLKVLASVR